jgi:hypothetical protein
MPPSPLPRVRRICLALPGAHEVEAWETPTFRVKNKLFAMYVDADNEHHPGVPALWIKSTPVNQEFLLLAKPRRHFKPPYVGPSGWIGVKLNGIVNWGDIESLLRDAYDMTAPKLRASPRPRRPAR